jgi:hypothetical protein
MGKAKGNGKGDGDGQRPHLNMAATFDFGLS